MSRDKKAVLEVFYDGDCRVCRREMEHYRQLDRSGNLQLIDIAASDFDAVAYGRNRDDFMASLHVRDAEGRYHVGVDAFARIWEVVPATGFSLLAAIVQLPVIHALAGVAYGVFARFRRYLPKTAGGCTDDSCRLGHRSDDKVI